MLKQIETKFIAGQTSQTALTVVNRLNQKSIRASLGILFPAVKDNKDADENTRKYVELLEKIKSSNSDSNISVKPSHIGLSISEPLFKRNLLSIVEAASNYKNRITIDVDNYKYKNPTLHIFEKIHSKHKNIRITVQACLHSSYHETKILIEKNAPICLMKGSYSPSQSVAFKLPEDINKNYIEIVKLLLNSDSHHAFATHDTKIIDFIKYAIKTKGLPKRSFEFQMLYGVKNSIAEELAGDGYSVRMYVPFGKEWIPYVIQRIQESWR